MSETTDWRVLEIPDRKQPDRLHVFVVERCVKSWGEGPSAGGSIALKAYHVAGDGALPESCAPQLVASMGGEFRPDLQHGGLGWLFTLTGGSMQVEPRFRGMRLGSYLQNETVRWARNQGRPGHIKKIFLGPGDASTDEARDRRNRFYEQFGIRFKWVEDSAYRERAEGSSVPELTIEDIHELPFIHGVTTLEPVKALQTYAQRAHRAEAKARDAALGLERTKASYTTELGRAHTRAFTYGTVAIVLGLIVAAMLFFRHQFFA